MHKTIFSALLALLFLAAGSTISSEALAQTDSSSLRKYFVYFTDKEGVEFDPYAYFCPKAIEMRKKKGRSLCEFSDLPVKPCYKRELAEHSALVLMESRWFNGVCVMANDEQFHEIAKLPFVKQIENLESECLLMDEEKMGADELLSELDEKDFKFLENQIHRIGGKSFEQANLDGKGMRIAVFDAGFPSVQSNPAFEHLRNDNRIIATWDFVGKDENVYHSSSHGTMVLSCIAGKLKEHKIGLATGAEFLLARTESGIYEGLSEEQNWLAAAEWADKNGVDIINSSLGYTNKRYRPSQMNGKHAFVSRAANFAASKGILVVNANGNEGEDSDWKIMGAPADADSVLSVGGIEPKTNFHIDFSSFGPTSDMRLKPNVCYYGYALVVGKNGTRYISGTSFASPLIAGFAACAWQAKPELSNIELFKEIEQSAELFPYYDYAHGYGVPSAEHFVKADTSKQAATFELIETYEGLKKQIMVNIFDEHFAPVRFKPWENIGHYDFVYYHLADANGVILEFSTISPGKKSAFVLPLPIDTKAAVLRVHYRGYTLEHKFQ